MRAKKIHRLAYGDVKLGNKIVTAIKARKPKPTLLVVRGYSYPD